MPEAPPPGAAPRRDFTAASGAVVVGALLWFAVYGAWSFAQHHPALLVARATARLAAAPPPAALAMPVQGIAASRVADTFGAPRGSGRRHEGLDIFAPRGTPVLSATDGIVTSVREGGLGGRQVWVLGPGGERHYYAHLDDWALALRRGDRVRPGTELGSVGDTGNARGTPPHLHYGVYGASGAVDPLPRLRAAR